MAPRARLAGLALASLPGGLALASIGCGGALLLGLARPELPDLFGSLEPPPGPEWAAHTRALALTPGRARVGPATPAGPFDRASVQFELRAGQQARLAASRDGLGRHTVDDRVEVEARCNGGPPERRVIDYWEPSAAEPGVRWLEPRDLTELLSPGDCQLTITLVDLHPPYHWSSPLFLVLEDSTAGGSDAKVGLDGRPGWLAELAQFGPARALGLALLVLGLALLGLLAVAPPVVRAAFGLGRTAGKLATAPATVLVKVSRLGARSGRVVPLAPGQEVALRGPGQPGRISLRRPDRGRAVWFGPELLTAESPLALRHGLKVELLA